MNFKKIILVVGVLVAGMGLAEPGEGPDGEAFTLDTSCPKADEPLTVEVAEGVGSPETLVYRWLRGDWTKNYKKTVSSTASYTPTAADYEHWFKFELEIVSNGQTYPVGSKEFFFSKLPVLYMTTSDGKNPTSNKEEHAGRLLVQGNALFDTTYDNDFTIHVRGNSTAGYPKLPYKIKLAEKTAMFGIAKNKHWVLLANYLDPSLVRNKIAYDFADVLGNKPAVKSTWVDCVLNGRWIGCYLFCEHLRVGEKRVNVYDWEGAAEDCAKALVKYYPDLKTALNGDKGPLEDLMKEDFSWVTSGKVTYAGQDWNIDTTVFPDYSQNITGGYFFELSQEYDSISQWKVEKGKLVVPTMINAPEYLNSNNEMMQYCKDYWSQYWDAVRSSNGYAGGKHWKELCKLNSMVTYWLTMEIFGNNDASKKSRFAYKDVDDKLYFGPVWDFDWGMGSVPSDDTNPAQWKLMAWDLSDSFFREWFDDPLFCTRAWEKYHEFRTQLGNLVAADGILDQHKAYLQEAGNANSEKWPSMTWNPGSGNRTAYQSFNQDIEALRVFLSGRIKWLDQQFASVDTLMNSLQNRAAECPNAPCASPYKRDKSTLPIAFKDVEPVADSPEKSVLHVAHEKGKDLEVSFTLGSGATSVASVETYVNGLIVGEGVPAKAGEAFYVKIPDKKMDAKAQDGQRDCVQFVARNSSGGVVARNYALVTSIITEPEPPVDPPVDPTEDPTVDPPVDPTVDPTVDPPVDPTPSTDRKGTIKFRVHFWDQANYWAKSSTTAKPDELKNNGRTTIPVNGLVFVLKSHADGNVNAVLDNSSVPVGRPNTSEGWMQSRVEAKYKGLDGSGNEIWDATYEISSEQLQYLKSGWVIDADPDTADTASYDRGLGLGLETAVFDWDRGIQGGTGTIPTGVREIPEGDRYKGKQPLGACANDVALITQDMIDHGFEFTFDCWVMPVKRGAEGEGVLSANTFGYLQVASSTTNTMVAVPWTWYSYWESDATSIPADKLVKTTNLEVGDCLYAYSGSGAYLGWTVEDHDGVLEWTPIQTVAQVGGNSQVIVHDETGNNRTILPRGVGVWLVRKHPFDKNGGIVPFWLYGQSVTTSAVTAIAPKGAGEEAHSTMLGNPYSQEVHINDLEFVGTVSENDTIVVPNGTDSPRYLEYRDTGTKRKPTGVKKWVWVHVDTSSGLPKNVYDWDVTIPPGLAFWYVRRATGDLSVTWKRPQ